MNLLADILEQAIARKIMITTAESCTGGLIAAALTDVPGSSRMFERGFVTYTNAAKHEMLGVQLATLKSFGAVSEEVAREMAQGAAHRSHAHLALSVTGIAGPGGSDFKPEGRVCFALSFDGTTTSETIEFGPLGRENVRNAARAHGVSMIHKVISQSH